MKVVAIGRTSMLYNSVLKLSEDAHEVKTIITAKSAHEYTRNEEEFKALAKETHASFFLTNRLDKPEIMRAIKGSDIAISVNWVSLFIKKQIDCFKIGILNAHMGDLPKYRGNACPNWAILNSEKEIVISIHLVEAGKLDCGRVIVQDRLAISQTTYIGDVYAWAETTIPDLFVKALAILRKDPDYELKYADADAAESFRCYPRRPEDSKIEWTSSTEKIHRLIRASGKPFSGAYGFLDGKKLIVWKAEPCSGNERYTAVPGQICEIGQQYFVVATGEGKLKITEWECGARIKTIRQRLQ